MKKNLLLFGLWAAFVILPMSVILYTFEKEFAKQIILINATACLYALVVVMARDRDRNATLWLLFSLIATPLVSVLLLYLIGDYDNGGDEKLSYYGDEE